MSFWIPALANIYCFNIVLNFLIPGNLPSFIMTGVRRVPKRFVKTADKTTYKRFTLMQEQVFKPKLLEFCCTFNRSLI